VLPETVQASVILRLFSVLPTQEPTLTIKELLLEVAAVISAVTAIATAQGGQVSLEAAVPIQIQMEIQVAAVFLEIAIHHRLLLLQTIIVVAAGRSVTVAAAVQVLLVQAAVQQLLQADVINDCCLNFQFSKL
jgi:hypothetical protein